MRLSTDRARELFTRTSVARLATADQNAIPHLVPVTFAARADTVVTAVDHKPKRTTDLRRLRNIEANPAVCLLTDHYDEDWEQLWWARADGTATVLPSPAGSPGHTEYLDLLRDKYPQYRAHPPDGPVIHVRVTTWTGWAAR